MNGEPNPEKQRLNISVQPASEQDFDAIIEIENKLAGKTYIVTGDATKLKELMDKESLYVIKKEQETVGLVSYYEEDNGIYIDALGVDPKFQGQGIGREAMNRTLAQIQNTQKIWLVTHPENPAIKLYESLGFKVTERMENYFGDGQPRVKMVLERNK